MPRGSRRPHLTASNRLLWPALGALRSRTDQEQNVLASVGLDEETAFALEGRVTLDQLFSVWQQAASLIGSPALGVRLGALLDPSSTVSWPMPLAFFEHLGLVSPTLADAISTTNRYLRLMRDGLRMSVDIENERALFRLEVMPEEPPALVEFDFAIATMIARRVAKRVVPAHEVWFTHEAPPSTEAHQQLFQAPIRFNAPFNAIIADAALFRAPLATANEAMRRRMLRHAESMLARLPSIDLFEDKVSAQIRAELPSGNTNASAVAEKLKVSARTLHRRLQHEGTSYQELLDAVRLRLAVNYLDGGKSISEVALLVGFAQASTFHRAFRGWTGETPADYQLRKRPGGSRKPGASPSNAPDVRH